MNKLFSLFLFCMVLIPAVMHAQDTTLTDLPKQWRLEDCIEYAKKKNISLAAVKLNIKSAEEDLLQARAGVLPNLNGTVSANLVNSKNVNPVVGGFSSQAAFANNFGVNSSMVLYNGGYLKNDIRSKQLSVQSSNLSVQETENDLTLSITQAFFNILVSKETIDALQSVLETSRVQLQQGQQRFDAGSIAKKDYLQFQAQVATDEYNLIDANNTLRLNIVTLKQYLLLPSSYDLQITPPDTITVKKAVASLPEAQSEAQQTRAEVKNGEVQVQISQVELEKIKASVKPSISLGGGLATGYSDNESIAYVPQLNNNFYQTIGATMSIPIYSRRVNKTNINKSKIVLQQTQLSLLNTKTVLNQQVEQAYINLVNAQARYDAAQKELSNNKEIYDITNEQLKLGAVTTVELLLQKNIYVQSLQHYTQAKYMAALYNKIYEFYTGVPVTL